MAAAFEQVAYDPGKARDHAMRGREWVETECCRDLAFADWRRIFLELAAGSKLANR